jgi:hypothetical protein
LSECFPRDISICLGTQLVSIVRSVTDFLPPHVWYACDVVANGQNIRAGFNSAQLKKMGSDLDIIEYCSRINQFTWGVFLCVDVNFTSQNIQDIELETEDEPFRSIPCNGVILEIRTFDTSYFEIYSDNMEVIWKISQIYQVEVETPHGQ